MNRNKARKQVREGQSSDKKQGQKKIIYFSLKAENDGN